MDSSEFGKYLFCDSKLSLHLSIYRKFTKPITDFHGPGLKYSSGTRIQVWGYLPRVLTRENRSGLPAHR